MCLVMPDPHNRKTKSRPISNWSGIDSMLVVTSTMSEILDRTTDQLAENIEWFLK